MKNDKAKRNQTGICMAVALGCLLVLPACGADVEGAGAGATQDDYDKLEATLSPSQLAGNHLIMAVGLKASTNDEMFLGRISFLDTNRVKANYYFFDAALNKKPWTSLGDHEPMDPKPPYAPELCAPGPIRAPAYRAQEIVNGSYTTSGSYVTVYLDNGMRMVWEGPLGTDSCFMLWRVYGTHRGRRASNGLGYAYLSDKTNIPGTLKKRYFADRYRGYLYHKNADATQSTAWTFGSTGLNPYKFTEHENPNNLSYTYPSNMYDAWVHDTILLNAAPASRLIFYRDHGHDFTMDGCYNEYGHSQMMFALYEAGRVTRFVMIEYSYNFDGYPMMSVARYFQTD